ncbi:MAG: SpoIID/LytB domain-containing protein [Candidatus Hydrogenedentota bacterium]
MIKIKFLFWFLIIFQSLVSENYSFNIKVKIFEDDEIVIESIGQIIIRSASGKSYYTGLLPNPIKAVCKNNNVVINAVSCNTQKVRIKKLTSNSMIKINSRRYRGNIELFCLGNKIIAIEVLDNIEDYIKGIIKLEINPKWNVEAVKAQAICSRTFAIGNMYTHSSEGYDFCSRPHCQVYGGYEAEDEAGNVAVDATRGFVMYYGEEIAEAYYCANNGGVTALNSEVWEREALPYFEIKNDEYSLKGEYSTFETFISFAEINKLLNLNSTTLEIIPEEISPSGRILKSIIRYDGGREIVLTKNDIRKTLGYDRLRSSLFTIFIKDNGIYIVGRGWGHGVGLSQWGAKVMADSGYTYQDIINFYFPGISIRRLYY